MPFGTIVTFSQSAGRVVQQYLKRQPVFLPTAVKEARLRECHSRAAECFNEATGRCRVCNCFVLAKTALVTEKCPKGYWPSLPVGS